MTSPPNPQPNEVVTRLRAAGCVFAEEEAGLLIAESASATELRQRLDRRVAGEPLEYILGWAEFCGLRIIVDAGVFVPRRRSALLVSEAVAVVPRPSVVVDMCCGSGAIGVAVAEALDRRVELHAVDIDEAAVRCAASNVAIVGGSAHRGDLFDALPASVRGRVDIVLCNAPYVPSDEIGLMPPEARSYEPHVALDGGSDGVDVQRRVIAAAGAWLAAGGQVLVETSESQLPLTTEAFAASGFATRVAHAEESGGTAVIGVLGERRGSATEG
jgi:release factor glutamine methyltransferase